jgi:hypothetical protein
MSILLMEGTILAFVWPAFVLPTIIAPIILKYRLDNELNKLIATLVFKPVIATLLWALILMFTMDYPQFFVLTLAPGLGLTLVIVWKFRRLIRVNTIIMAVLIGLDILRWGNTFLTMTLPVGWYRFEMLRNPYESLGYCLGLLLPNVYAMVGLLICMMYARQQNIHQS